MILFVLLSQCTTFLIGGVPYALTSAPEYPSVKRTISSISTSLLIGVLENCNVQIARRVSKSGSET